MQIAVMIGAVALVWAGRHRLAPERRHGRLHPADAGFTRFREFGGLGRRCVALGAHNGKLGMHFDNVKISLDGRQATVYFIFTTSR